MTLKQFILTLTLIITVFQLIAQKQSDLGSFKPYLVGLKGTIYKFSFPVGYKWRGKVGYTPEIEKTTPIGYIYTQTLNISERELTAPFPGVPKNIKEFAIIYTGNFEVKETDDYEFVLKSDDGSRLWIDEKEVINHDGLHQFKEQGKGIVKLNRGFHSMKVWYFQGMVTRMGLLLLMRKKADKDFNNFDLKPLEDELKTVNQTDSSVVNIRLNEKVLFDVSKFEVKPEADSQLLQIVKLLILKPNSTLRIEGHTDNVGSAKSNQVLSENRAFAVANVLKTLGLPPTVTIITKGFGLTQPIVPNDSEDGRVKNRRVEISILTN
jgi:outer membrane protein OmpA-like peptidoglycan-associated protein